VVRERLVVAPTSDVADVLQTVLRHGVGEAGPAPSWIDATKGSLCYDRRVKFRVLIEQDEDGVFVATCPSLPGCVAQGATREEAHANITDAVEGYVASLKKHGEPIPPPIDEDLVEVGS